MNVMFHIVMVDVVCWVSIVEGMTESLIQHPQLWGIKP